MVENFSVYNILLPLCVVLPIFGIFGILFTNIIGIYLDKNGKNYTSHWRIIIQFNKVWSLFITILVFFFSLILWVNFKNLVMSFQYVCKFSFFDMGSLVEPLDIFGEPLTLSSFYINCFFGLDGLSLVFVILTTFILPLCVLSIWSIDFRVSYYLVLLLALECFLILSFISLDLFLFYIFFESILVPMFLIIGVWGSRSRKIKASYYFFIYTLIGSLLMLLGIILLFLEVGTTSYDILLLANFTLKKQKVIWCFFFLALCIKVPTFPFHIWLPEAHVEAPTTGSIILASLLLKLGGYGLLRFLIPLFPQACWYFLPLVYTLAIVSIIYASFTTIRQIDLKRIIAYSSVAHMNLAVLGIFSLNTQGISGSIILMLGHGVVSGALFLMVGILYNRYHSRLLQYYGGLTITMPIFSVCFLVFNLSNLGLPGTSNFVGEALILFGIFQTNIVVAIAACTGMVLSAAYSLWMFNRVSFGTLKIKYIKFYMDINRREFYMIFPLIFMNFLIGLYPAFILDIIYPTVKYITILLFRV